MNLQKLFGIAAVATMVACGHDYDHTEITQIIGSYSSADTVSLAHIQVTEGNVVTAHIVLKNDDNEKMPLHILSDNPNTCELEPVVNPDVYAFIGKAAGKTTVQFISDEDNERIITIHVDVIPEPSGP
jgi:hypothetical protein